MIQVLADNYCNVVTLAERDCSLQRKHQKVMEEAPAIVLDEKTREDICSKVRNAVKSIGYTNAGTIEFMYQDGKFYFMEMNTRLQVEHPITEMITGVDIVKEQIRIAMGEKLSVKQEDIKIKGHALEFRINAEDPDTFVPWPGTIDKINVPGGLGVRIESGVYAGYKIPSFYDSMIAKLIVFADTRQDCLVRAEHALKEFVVEGVRTNLPLHKELIKQKEVIDNANYDNNWLEKWIAKHNEEKAKLAEKEKQKATEQARKYAKKQKSDMQKLTGKGVEKVKHRK